MKNAICAVLCLAAITEISAQSDSLLKLWYNQPAQQWVEALPVGNGRLGAMVYGDPAHEKIQLNESTVWAGQPNRNDNPDAKEALPEVRKLIFEGKYKEAQDLATLSELAESGSLSQQAEVALKQASYAWATGSYPTVNSAAEKAVKLGQGCGRPDIAAHGYWEWAWGLTRLGAYDQAGEYFGMALELAQQLDQPRLETIRSLVLGEPSPAR